VLPVALVGERLLMSCVTSASTRMRPEHVLIIATVILLLRKGAGALDLVLDALGQRVSLIFSADTSVASEFSLLLSFIQIL